MARVTAFTAERTLEIENRTITSGFVDDEGRLWLERRDGQRIDAGIVAGEAGAPGSGVDDITVTYQSGSSGTVQPTGEWVDSPPLVPAGHYLWIRTVTTYRDPGNPENFFTTVAYQVIRQGTPGRDGEDGQDGVGIQNRSVQYQEGISGINPPTGTWFPNPPEVQEGRFLWTRITIEYTDNTYDVAYSVAKQGVNGEHGTPGEPGDDGRTSYLHVAYSNSEDGTEDFSVTDPSGRSYMGVYTSFVEDDSTNPADYTWTLIKGASGAGITNSFVHYSIGLSGQTPPSGDWSIDVPVVPEGYFLWTRTVITFSDGASQTSYSIAKNGEKGEPGEEGPPGEDGQPGEDGDPGISIVGVVTYWLMNHGTEPTAPTVKVPPAPWVMNEPPYQRARVLWRIERVDYSDGSWTWTTLAKVSSYTGADNAMEKAEEVESALAPVVQAAQQLEITQGLIQEKLIEHEGEIGNAQTELETTGTRLDNAVTEIEAARQDAANALTAAALAIKSQEFEYALNSSETVAPTSGWSTTPPTRAPGSYIWQRVRITYGDDTSVTTPAVLLTGNKGADGADGEPGIQGPPGADGTSLYTWIKYADTPTSGMSDTPTGKTYIGIAYNKPTATKSTAYNQYSWSLIKGETGDQGIQGPPGVDGSPTYTWIKYASTSTGGSMSDSPTGKTYIGLAHNKPTATESNTASDYTWSLIKGTDGQDGQDGDPGRGVASVQSLYRYGKNLSNNPELIGSGVWVEKQRNDCTNPSFETNANFEFYSSTSVQTLAQTTTAKYVADGERALVWTLNSDPAVFTYMGFFGTIRSGMTHVAASIAKASVINRSGHYLTMRAGFLVGSSWVYSSMDGEYRKPPYSQDEVREIKEVFVIPSGATQYRILIYPHLLTTSNTVAAPDGGVRGSFDGWVMDQGISAEDALRKVESFYDGSTPNAEYVRTRWLGVAHESASIKEFQEIANLPRGAASWSHHPYRIGDGVDSVARFELTSSGVLGLPATNLSLPVGNEYTLCLEARSSRDPQAVIPRVGQTQAPNSVLLSKDWTKISLTATAVNTGWTQTGFLVSSSSGHQIGDLIDMKKISLYEGNFFDYSKWGAEEPGYDPRGELWRVERVTYDDNTVEYTTPTRAEQYRAIDSAEYIERLMSKEIFSEVMRSGLLQSIVAEIQEAFIGSAHVIEMDVSKLVVTDEAQMREAVIETLWSEVVKTKFLEVTEEIITRDVIADGAITAEKMAAEFFYGREFFGGVFNGGEFIQYAQEGGVSIYPETAGGVVLGDWKGVRPDGTAPAALGGTKLTGQYSIYTYRPGAGYISLLWTNNSIPVFSPTPRTLVIPIRSAAPLRNVHVTTPSETHTFDDLPANTWRTLEIEISDDEQLKWVHVGGELVTSSTGNVNFWVDRIEVQASALEGAHLRISRNHMGIPGAYLYNGAGALLASFTPQGIESFEPGGERWARVRDGALTVGNDQESVTYDADGIHNPLGVHKIESPQGILLDGPVNTFDTPADLELWSAPEGANAYVVSNATHYNRRGGNWIADIPMQSTTQYTEASGFSVSSVTIRRFGPVAYIQLLATRTGPTVSVGATGNYVNQDVLTLNPALGMNPSFNGQGLWSSGDGGLTAGFIRSNGTIAAAAGVANRGLNNGETISLGGTYFLW